MPETSINMKPSAVPLVTIFESQTNGYRHNSYLNSTRMLQE